MKQIGVNVIANNAVTETFSISDPAVASTAVITVNIDDLGFDAQCEVRVVNQGGGAFSMTCGFPPPDGSKLKYTAINLPLS